MLNFIIIGVILGGLYLISVYSPIIKVVMGQFFDSSTKMVKGVKTSSYIASSSARMPALPDKIKSDVATQVASLKKQVMNLKIQDFFAGFLRLKKVVHDIQTLPSNAQNTIKHVHIK